MLRTLLTAGTFAVATIALAQTPPTPTPTAPMQPTTPPAAAATSEYYPLKAGAKWTYKIDDTRTLEMRVDKIENGEALIQTVAQGRTVAKDTIKVSADGIYRTKINDLKIDPPIKILTLPVKKGDAWEIKAKVQEKEIAGKLTVVNDKEKIKLKDGTEYECVLVDGPDFKVDGSATKMKIWFVAGKGIVKLTYETGQQEATLELQKYEEAAK